jgi:kynurenine formamidase
MESRSIDDVRSLQQRYSNWSRWGADDQVGTLNFVGPEQVRAAAGSIRSGKRISMALPFGADGPQTGRRFNPIHLMIRDGADVMNGTAVRDFYGGRDRHFRGTDDVIIMPLQSGTQWDSLAHVVFEEKIYNGYSAADVTSKGAMKNAITETSDRIVGRGVLLDIARDHGVDSLAPGYAITGEDLTRCAERQGVTVQPGDFVMVRTGHLGVRKGSWGDYAGGSSPGMGLDSVPWICENEIAGLATDTWGMEVLPNETEDVYQPLHLILIVHVGLLVGEIFDLEELGRDCAEDGQYDFLFSAAPLPISHAVGSPVNPIAIK